MRLGVFVLTAACSVPVASNPPTSPSSASDSVAATPETTATIEASELEPVDAPDPEPSAPEPSPFEPTAFSVEISGHGRPVILIPGLACPGSVWRETVAHLADAETHVLTLSGFAGRPAIAGLPIATARAELATYIRDRKLDHPVVIGHSLGALLAYSLAITEPDLVGPIVAVDEPLGWCSADQLATARARGDGWARMSPYDFAQTIREFFEPMARDPMRLAPIVAAALRSDPRTVGDATYELCAMDLRPNAVQLSTPVLAVLADGPYQRMIRAQVATIPNSEVVVVPHTRHFVMLDDPRGFFATLDAFLAAHPR